MGKIIPELNFTIGLDLLNSIEMKPHKTVSHSRLFSENPTA